MSWAASFSRSLVIGNAEVYVGPYDIIVICEPHSHAEQAVLNWVEKVDGATLIDCAPLEDGRDVLLLSRNYSKQDQVDAIAESRQFILDSLQNGSRAAVSSFRV